MNGVTKEQIADAAIRVFQCESDRILNPDANPGAVEEAQEALDDLIGAYLNIDPGRNLLEEARAAA